MKILSVATATKNLSVAVNENDEILTEKNIDDQRNHSVDIIPTIQQVLSDNHLLLNQIDQLAVAIGPGSYTGLRIGVTTMKVLSQQLEIPVVGVDTLAALAQNVAEPNTLVATVLDARNNNFFGGLFLSRNQKNDAAKMLEQSQHLNIDKLIELIKKYENDEIKKIIFVGDFTAEHQEYFIDKLSNDLQVEFGNQDQNIVHAGQIGDLALNLKATPAAELIPAYLRKTQAEVEWEEKQSGNETDTSYVEEV